MQSNGPFNAALIYRDNTYPLFSLLNSFSYFELSDACKICVFILMAIHVRLKFKVRPSHVPNVPIISLVSLSNRLIKCIRIGPQTSLSYWCLDVLT